MGSLSILVIISPFLLALVAGKPYNDEEKLRNALFKEYDHGIRPVKNFSDKIIISLGMTAVTIMETNNQNVFKMKSWVIMSWKDERLKWDVGAYGGVKNTRVPYKKIWRPDINLFNSVERGALTPTFDDTMALINNDGTIMYVPPTFLAVPCESQNNANSAMMECGFTFGSWTYDGDKLDLSFYEGKKAMELGMLMHNDQWKPTSSSAKRQVKHYPCCTEPYPSITFKIKLKSRYNQDTSLKFERE